MNTAAINGLDTLAKRGSRELTPIKPLRWFFAFMGLVSLAISVAFYLGISMADGMSKTSVALAFAGSATTTTFIMYFLLRKLISDSEMARMQHVALVEEQRKAERVLVNVLPQSIAERLKNDQVPIADGHADVTVMFADLVNFTQFTEQMSPKQMVELLDTVFSGFDELADRYGLEKIKTVGDAYMVVGGLTRQNHDYADHIAHMAIELLDYVSNHPALAKRDLGIHIGIATGPVVAGVIGTKRFIYDLWGDTVNIASRLTDDAAQGQILTDRMTHIRLRHRFQFSPPKIINVKGKGEMVAYRLNGCAHQQPITTENGSSSKLQQFA